jgi:NADH:ubiquinone oxidoreductase subunit 6 (subunit J)
MLPPVLAAGDAWARLWPLLPPLLAGAVAVYFLLPRPRPLPPLRGVVLGLLAVVLGGVFVVPATVASPETVLFYAFSAIALVAGALLVTQHNPARAALSFALVVLATCGLFLLLAAPFLMAATIIIYAGAIIVTFLFVLMLAQQEGPSDADARSREPLLATVTGFLLLGALVYVIQASYGDRDLDRLLARIRLAQAKATREEVLAVIGNPGADDELHKVFHDLIHERRWTDLLHRYENEIAPNVDTDDLDKIHKTLAEMAAVAEEARERLAVLQPAPQHTPLSDLSGPSAATPPAELRRDALGRPVLPADNPAYLGRSLFTDFLLPVELGGTLLLVATVGAIAIAHRNVRRQSESGRAS